MPSSKKKKVMKGGRSCPVGSQKVCISKGELVKLLKRAAIKKQKTRKKGKKVPKANKVVEEKKTKSVYESIFGSKEETEKPKTDTEEPSVEEPSEEPAQVTEEPAQVTEEPTEPATSEPATSVETQPQKETSFLGSIFGTNEKPATPVAK